MTLKWFGDDVRRTKLAQVADAMGEFGLRVETASKRELQPGHGVRTGTLRRSIHCAPPDYPWTSDNIESADGMPDLGGKEVKPVDKGGKMVLEVGSGLEYSMPIHQGFGSFEGYHYLTNGLEKMRPELPKIIKRHTGGK